MWCIYGIDTIILFNRLAQTFTCSAAIVLTLFDRELSGFYLTLHKGSLWFCKCRRSITFPTFCHILLNGAGRGKSFLEIRRESKWHMLSYAKTVSSIAWSNSSSLLPLAFKAINLLNNQTTVIIKAWVGDSDLKYNWNARVVKTKEIIFIYYIKSNISPTELLEAAHQYWWEIAWKRYHIWIKIHCKNWLVKTTNKLVVSNSLFQTICFCSMNLFWLRLFLLAVIIHNILLS